jgi:hypothetical protein
MVVLHQVQMKVNDVVNGLRQLPVPLVVVRHGSITDVDGIQLLVYQTHVHPLELKELVPLVVVLGIQPLRLIVLITMEIQLTLVIVPEVLPHVLAEAVREHMIDVSGN